MLAMNSIVAVYDTQTEVAAVVRDLDQAAFDLRKLSILGREHESAEHMAGYYQTQGRMKYWGPQGIFWNDLWKLLEGAGHFAIPGVGRILTAGPLTVGLVEAMDDPSVDGLSPVGVGLSVMSIPRGSVLRYESALKMHKLLLVAYGDNREILQCREVLRATQPRETNIHFATEAVQSAA
jgi:hypothetical protein